jgi:hypothetical protein
MTHHDADHYAAKHPKGTQIDPRIESALTSKLSDNNISCAAAHALAADLSVSPAQIGLSIDLMEARITKCQLGLFGYSPQKKIVQAANSVSRELKTKLEASLVDNRISCLRCWEIAAELSLKKIDVSAACEALGIKIKPCQLGAF